MDKDCMEKICCFGVPSTDPLTLAAAMNGGNFGNRNGMWDNPFAYLMFILFANRLGFNGDGSFNGQGQQNVEIQSQLQAIRTQMQDNQNSGLIMGAINGNADDIKQLANKIGCDFNTLNGCCCDLKAAIAQLAGQVGYSKEAIIGAIEKGDCGLARALENCCCSIKQQISDFRGSVQLQMCEQTNTLRGGQRDLGQAISEGFAKSSF